MASSAIEKFAGGAPLVNKNSDERGDISTPIIEMTPTFPPLESTYGNRAKYDEHYIAMEDGPNDDSDQPQAHEDVISISSSVLTAEGLADPLGFFIICFVVLIGDMNRGVLFPVMWPLVQELGGNSVWLGYAVGAFSFGRIIASPGLGKWSIERGYTKTLLLSTSIMFIGCLFFAQVHRIGSLLFLVFSQITMGIGSATLGVTRAYVAEITATRQRTTYIAWLTAVQYGGFTVTPFFGSLFMYLLQDRKYELGLITIDKYSAPAYFMSFLCIITFVFLITGFRERCRSKPEQKKKSKTIMQRDDAANTITWFGLTTYNAALIGCMLLNVSTKGSIGAFETMGISYAQSHFGLSAATAGTIVSMNGVIGVFSLLSMGCIGRVLTDVQMIIGGITVCALGIIGFSPLHSVEDGAENAVWKYVVGILMIYGVGYPIGHTAVIGLFSKVVGRRPQGTLQGWFASAGSLARILFPIMSGYIAYYDDISTVFVVLFVNLVISNCFVAMSARTLEALSI